MDSLVSEKIKMIRLDLENTFRDIELKHKVRINIGAVSYNDLYFTTSMKGVFLDSNGSTEEANKAEFNLYASKFGLKQEWFGKTVMIGMKAYKIVGIAPRARKYPVVGEKSGGKYKLTAQDVIYAFGKMERETITISEKDVGELSIKEII